MFLIHFFHDWDRHGTIWAETLFVHTNFSRRVSWNHSRPPKHSYLSQTPSWILLLLFVRAGLYCAIMISISVKVLEIMSTTWICVCPRFQDGILAPSLKLFFLIFLLFNRRGECFAPPLPYSAGRKGEPQVSP